MNRLKRMVADMPQQPDKPPERAVGQCAAHGCPLPGTIRTEASGADAVCGCHVVANRSGWPLATVVTRRHGALWVAAREASCAGLPDGARKDLAEALFATARASGLTFNQAQREEYSRAGMKLRTAGAIIEAAIASAAQDASMRAASAAHEEIGESPLAMLIKRLAHYAESETA